jgi:hypothetical protein
MRKRQVERTGHSAMMGTSRYVVEHDADRLFDCPKQII